MKEIEDSELLEVMDVCDQEGSTNPTTQEHVTPAPPTAQVIGTASPESLKSAVMSQEDKEEIKEKTEDDHMAQGEGSSGWPCPRVCHTHERAIPIQQTVEALDMTEEGTHAPISQTLSFKSLNGS